MFNESTRAKYVVGTKVTGTAYKNGEALPGVSTGQVISIWDEVIVRWDNPEADDSRIRNLDILTIVPPSEAELKKMASALSWVQAEILYQISIGDFRKTEPLGMRSSIRYTSKNKSYRSESFEQISRFVLTDWSKSDQTSWCYKLTDLGKSIFEAFMSKYGDKLIARIEST